MGCPLCGAAQSQAIYRLAHAPVTCTSIFDSAAEAIAVPGGEIDLVACERCGFAHNRSFDPGIAELGLRYESSQGASPHFTSFARALAEEWIERYALRGKTILEVGCGEGEFLTAMIAAGASHGIGLDPLAPSTNSDHDKRSFIRDTLQESHEAIDAAALVCRHTLEHVGDPGEFLARIHRWAAYCPGRVVLFEIPAAEYLREERAFWDIYYEHCNYFSAPVLRQAFENAGFDVRRCNRVYDGQYLILEAVAGEAPHAPRFAPEDELQSWARFSSQAGAAIDACRQQMAAMGRGNRPLVIWQGAAKTVGVLTACGSIQGLACAVDLNAGRHGRYLPGSGLQVQPPGYLPSIHPAYVVLMNAVYRAEVQKRLDELGLNATLLAINDLFTMPA